MLLRTANSNIFCVVSNVVLIHKSCYVLAKSELLAAVHLKIMFSLNYEPLCLGT